MHQQSPPERWQVEPTLGNIKILKKVREKRNELVNIENKSYK